MNKLVLITVALLAFAGCKKKETNSSAAAAMAKMAEFKDEMCKCKDAKCAQDVSDKMTKWSQEQTKAGQATPKMTDADQKKAADLGEEMGKCMQAAMAPTTQGSATTEPTRSDGSAGSAGSAGTACSAAATADGLPPECAEYKATVEKLKSCDKMPPKAKDALIKAFNDASAGWANMPEGAKAGLNQSCKAGTEAVAVAAKEACGW